MQRLFPSWVMPLTLLGILLIYIPCYFLVLWLEKPANTGSPILGLAMYFGLIGWSAAYTWNTRLELSNDTLVMNDSFMRQHRISPSTHALNSIEGPDVPVLRERGNMFIYFVANTNPKKRLKVNLSLQKPEGRKAVHEWIQKNYLSQGV